MVSPKQDLLGILASREARDCFLWEDGGYRLHQLPLQAEPAEARPPYAKTSEGYLSRIHQWLKGVAFCKGG